MNEIEELNDLFARNAKSGEGVYYSMIRTFRAATVSGLAVLGAVHADNSSVAQIASGLVALAGLSRTVYQAMKWRQHLEEERVQTPRVEELVQWQINDMAEKSAARHAALLAAHSF